MAFDWVVSVNLKPDRSTAANRAYWDFVEKTRDEVRTWPSWKRPKGIGLVERAAARGVTFIEPPDAQREIDRMTGKRIAND